LPQRSCGFEVDDSWLLDCNGYVGAYLKLERAAPVSVVIQASGLPDRGQAPRMTVTIADSSSPFEVARDRRSYTHRVVLAPGTYFVRIQHTDDQPEANRELTIHSVAVSGATVSTANTDANALEAADTYIRHYRTGPARVVLPGVAPGTRVRVALERHAFNFGANVPYRTNKLLPERAEPASDAAWYQEALLENFNTVVLSNGGKWLYQEEGRDKVDLAYIDRFLSFARQNQLRARMHTMLWDTVQQPVWVVSEAPAKLGLLTRALAGSTDAKRELTAEIDERIDYYVRARARDYVELDVLNESLHRPRYFQAYGAAGIAEIFNKTAAAVKQSAGKTRLFLNEYNLLQWSTDPRSGVPDAYANWYRLHAEELLRAGGTIDGLGVQYYADGRSSGEIGSNAHSPARIMQVLQNLSLTGRRISLTEFAVNAKSATPARAAEILEQTLRLVFGTPQADSFLIWAIWAGAADPPAPSSVLFDLDRQPTEPGRRYKALMQSFTTDLELTVAGDGAIEFVGVFGDYRIELPAAVRSFSLLKGTSSYSAEAQQPRPVSITTPSKSP
jgi:GH35 family endo-1,4-beta-xylanase